MDYYDHLIEIEQDKIVLESDKPRPGQAQCDWNHKSFVLFHETRQDHKTTQDKTTQDKE